MQFLGHAFEHELARRGRRLAVLGATSGDTGSAAEHALQGQARHRGLHALAARPDEPVPAGADVQPAGRQHPQHRHRGRVRRLPGPRQGGLGRPRLQARAFDRHGQLDQLGAPAGAGRLLLRRLLPGDAARRRGGRLRRADRQLRQHLRRPRRAQHGPADPPPGARDQRERRPRRVLPHRRLPRPQRRRDARDVEPVDGHLEGVELRALRLRCARPRRGANARALRRGRDAARLRARRARARADRRVRLRERAQHLAPTAWRRSATCTTASAR